MKRERIILHGSVQGVGCRPFIHNLAVQHELTGFIYNDVDGVSIEVQGGSDRVMCFIDTLRCPGQLPPLMKITACHCREIPVIPDEDTFIIQASDPTGTPSSHVTADSATCGDCIAEMNDPNNFRYRYPFINCTNCGPRYSIVKTIPYDRVNTTMSPFEMCQKCQEQYTEVSDRRFHAQPVACSKCGPKIWLTDSNGNTVETDSDKAIAKTSEMLSEGKILAIKGLGGFHLACDATNEEAVTALRQRKNREHKPFAMMAGSVDTINKYVDTDDKTIQLLKSPQSPVVLLNRRHNTKIAQSVANGVNTYGFMLPYTPLHHLIFAKPSIEVLVMTSANISDQPLICDNDIAVKKLANIADAFLMHDRVIYRQVDDSVIHIIDNDHAILRRSRGYTPNPILRSAVCEKQIFAAGADLKNTFCLAKGNQLLLSEHIGDLADGLVYRHYIGSVRHLQQLYQIQPEMIACDLHPAYFSTQYANTLGIDNIIQVQHHWAHIASVIAEHDYPEPVIGIVADGTGLGTDNAIWGGECLIASLTEFKRFAHLDYFPLAGGDLASKEPIRPVMGLLSLICEINTVPQKYSNLLESIEPNIQKQNIIAKQISKNLNTVKTSSIGRLFDAVAAMAKLGRYNNFEAQLPMALEAAAKDNEHGHYAFDVIDEGETPLKLDPRPMLIELIDDINDGTNIGVVSAKFHNALAISFANIAERARKKYGLNTVALSGGVFCNRYLANRLITILKERSFTVLLNRLVPANDGGIALGQAAIAAAITDNNNI